MHSLQLFPMPIPSPSQSVWWIGPIPLRAYGILIVLGMFVAIYIGKKRYAQRGGDGELLYDIAMWAIPLGIVGARLYHVITTPDDFFSSWEAMASIPKIWEGGRDTPADRQAVRSGGPRAATNRWLWGAATRLASIERERRGKPLRGVALGDDAACRS